MEIREIMCKMLLRNRDFVCKHLGLDDKNKGQTNQIKHTQKKQKQRNCSSSKRTQFPYFFSATMLMKINKTSQNV